MAGKRSTTGALREPPGLGFGGLLRDGARRVLVLLLALGWMQEQQQPVALAGEVGANAVADRRAVAELHSAGVLGDPVDAKFVVEVRPAGEPGPTDGADRLALFDP